jgi:hypothetical protein
MRGWRFRPWGLLDWVISKLPNVRWNLLGSLSTEDRWISAWWTVMKSGYLANAYFAQIHDEPSKLTIAQEKKLRQQRRKFIKLNGEETTIHTHELLCPNREIVQITDDFINSRSQNVILDISTLPKRYFFPFIKRILKNRFVRNFVVTYTVPKRYSVGFLSEDFQDWRPLPLFTGKYTREKPEYLVVGVGYLTMGLPEQIEKGIGGSKIKLIFPFPPGSPSYQRNWEFVRNVEKNCRNGIDIKVTDAKDVPTIFDHLLSITNSGSQPAIFAPFGPKTISLAMCIYATLTDSPVYYTQPTAYNPEYSSGISKIKHNRETYAYCLRLEGRNFYKIR